ncbi:MAG: recombination regulator RecX [candidate division KSB1 bacterium]|nr:recombination regulator RecX [candidate division KSB1 bacterium]MDZ7275741.1 recombination regulator RecX [candidate division KSB1 bacterium]MDZ7307728.1 recombination regulator RecX [candidate division KSB1 bacterium]MDZ7348878.1 recombination regulator RecX [candidate division KSB1 bacterium]MDZ7352679.1 recombination regulator RecX [candidate division KSB1 bacterium]
MIAPSGRQADLFEDGEDKLKAALTKAYRLLAQRSRTEKELHDALQKAGFAAEIVAAVLTECRRRHYLDDTGFARSFIQSRLRNRPMGRERLAAELRQKGIAAEIIATALDEVFTDSATLSLASQLAEKQRKKLAALPPRKARQKLADFLQRRGFDWETIRATPLWRELGDSELEE